MATAGLTILPNEHRGHLVAGWVFTLCFTAFISVFWWGLLAGNPTGDVWVGYIVIGLFSCFCLAAIWHMARVTLSVLRFGDVALRLQESPRAGGKLRARLELRKHDALRTVSLKLICNKVRWTRGSKGSRNRSETEFWGRAAPQAAVLALGQQARVEFTFDLPAHAPGTSEPDPASVELERDYFAWKLELRADVPGVDLFRTYDIAVEPAAGTAAPAMPAKADDRARKVPAAIEPEFSLWRRPSAWVLIAANVVPVAGVLFLGWSLFPVMFLFWLENVIVGLFNVLRIMNAGAGGAGKLFLVPFFVVHYGGFCAGHGVFVFMMFGREALREFGLDTGFPGPIAVSTLIAEYSLLPAVIALAASHGYSYFANYLGAGEYRAADPQALMGAPYGRVVVLHVLILVGGLLIDVLGSPVAFLALLVVLKTSLDLWAHGREHRKYAGLLVSPEAKSGVVATDEGPAPFARMAISALLAGAVAAAVFVYLPAPAARLSPEVLAKQEEERAGRAQPAKPEPTPGRAAPAAAPVRVAAPPSGTAARPGAWDGPASTWHAQYEMAVALRDNGKLAEAEAGLRGTLGSMEAWPAGPPPEAARILSMLADLHHDQGNKKAYEVEMARALEILERFHPLMVQERLGADADRIDKEALAREFGDYYWEQRRYDRGFEYYRRAHDAGLLIQVTEQERNRRLAFSSAGMMATACVLKNFDVADQAMQELKDRMQTVDAGSRQKLEYWVRTGEPRLKKRKC